MTLIFAHRGYNAKYPENSMLAFEMAAEVGADGIEIDVHLSKDGEVVVIHDETIDRTTYSKGYVKDYTLEELKTVHESNSILKKDLEPIPTLVEVLEWISPLNLFLNIELKNDKIDYENIEQKVIDLVTKYKIKDRVILSSFNHCSLVLCKDIAPEIDTAILFQENMYHPWSYAKTAGATAIHPYYKVATNDFIHDSQHNDIAVRPWTVNNPDTMKRLFEVDCAGIITDDPELAVEIRNSYN